MIVNNSDIETGAKAELNQALKLDPNFPNAEEAKATLGAMK